MDLPNRPCLLAFCRRAPRFEEAFRAELRALGAPLFAFAPGSGTIFGADDEPRDIGPHPELWRIHGAGRAALTVVLLDEKQRVRLRRDAPEAEGTLLAAVREAGRAVRAAPRRGGGGGPPLYNPAPPPRAAGLPARGSRPRGGGREGGFGGAPPPRG